MDLMAFLGMLQGVRGAGRNYRARCPAHDDRNPSLSVREGSDGRILLKCHAGCETSVVMAALGLSLGDLMPAGRRTPPDVAVRPRIVATYDYRDEDGVLLYQNVRLEPKSFRLRRPVPGDGWMWTTEGVRRVPYRLPDLAAAVRTGCPAIFIVEGEKDADALWRVGLPATTNVGGAGKWGAPETEALRALPGRPEFVILPDHDLAGARHGAEVSFLLREARLGARVVELPGLPAKGDVSDWLGQGHTAAELRVVCGLGLISRR